MNSVVRLSTDSSRSRNNRGMRGRFLTAAVILLCAGGAAAAEQAPICSDRPGKANATCTAPAGHFQLETGLADWTLDRSAGERAATLVLGATAIKYGLTDHSHIELDVTPWQRVATRRGGEDDSSAGFGDLVVRYKQRLTGGAVQATVFPFVKIPTAKHSLGNGKVEAGIDLPIGYAIAESRLSLSLMPELAWLADADGHGHHLAMAQVASLGWQLTPKINLSAEIWGQWNWDPAGTGKQRSADGSIAYLISNDLQLDGGANFGLNRRTPDIELYAGVSKRF